MTGIGLKRALIAGWITLIQCLSCASALCSERTSHHLRPLDIDTQSATSLARPLQNSLTIRTPCIVRLASKIRSDETKDDDKNDDNKDESILGRFKARAASITSSVQTTVNRLRRPFFRSKLHPHDHTRDEPTIDAPVKSYISTEGLPEGSRWEVAHPDIDLSGTWRPIITPEFLKKYDEYLTHCGSSYLFRQLCLKFCSTTRETITQQDDGRILEIDGRTPAGNWKRSLISSGASATSPQFQVAYAEFLDPDKERVQVEAWWEKDGSVHHSILRNKPSVGGGEFDTLRYLSSCDNTSSVNNDGVTEPNKVILVTESTFHPSSEHLNNPSSSKFKPAHIRWEYTRVS